MSLLAGLSKGAVISVSAAVIGSTAAITGAVLSGPADAVDNSSPSAYVRTVAPLAQANQSKYRVPASVAIAQSILESNWGKSGLTTRGNAYFGIKCSSTMGPYATGCLSLKTTEYDRGTYTTTARFRTYKNAQDSFYDHGWFLTNNSRYAAAFRYPTDAKRFIAEVARAGYATDPTYTSMIVGLMDRYNLYRYDKVTTRPSIRPTTAKPTTAKPTTAKPTTAKPTPTPSRTAAPTPTPTPTRTPTPTAAPSRTATPTPSPTPTATATPSRTATPTPSGTPASARAAASPTATASVTPSAAPSLNPATVRAEKAQDPMKIGVVPTAPRDGAVAAPKARSGPERSGGLAKTGA